MSLNLKQIRFADEFIRNGGNATQAAISAGYSERTAAASASRMLRNVNISDYIAKRQEEIDSVNIASLKEIQEFRTRVLRGEEKAFSSPRRTLVRNSCISFRDAMLTESISSCLLAM